MTIPETKPGATSLTLIRAPTGKMECAGGMRETHLPKPTTRAADMPREDGNLIDLTPLRLYNRLWLFSRNVQR